MAIDLYKYWKITDDLSRKISGRGINMPESISETIVAYKLKYKLIKKGGGDAMDCNDEEEKIIEIKATSSEEPSPNSFSPKEDFDDLIYIRFDKKADKYDIYKTGYNSEMMKSIKVNETETFEDHQKQGRRPRIIVEKVLIEDKKIKPFMSCEIKKE